MSQRQISQYVPERTEDNDPDLWPTGWDEGAHPALRDIRWEYIDPGLLPFYRRTAEADAQVRARYESGTRNPRTGDLESVYLNDEHNLLHRNGAPVVARPSTEEGMALILHFEAMRAARARVVGEREAALREARDRSEHTCAACGVVDRTSGVRSRSVGGWRKPDRGSWEIQLMERGPRLCTACHEFALVKVEELRRERARAYGSEETTGGRLRSEVVGLFLDANVERIMGT